MYDECVHMNNNNNNVRFNNTTNLGVICYMVRPFRLIEFGYRKFCMVQSLLLGFHIVEYKYFMLLPNVQHIHYRYSE